MQSGFANPPRSGRIALSGVISAGRRSCYSGQVTNLDAVTIGGGGTAAADDCARPEVLSLGRVARCYIGQAATQRFHLKS